MLDHAFQQGQSPAIRGRGLKHWRDLFPKEELGRPLYAGVD